MITVNLRPGKRRKSSGSPFNFKGMLDRFRGLGTKVKDPLLLGAVAGWVCVLGFLGFVYLNNVRQLYSLEPRLEQARSESRRFKAFLAQPTDAAAIVGIDEWKCSVEEVVPHVDDIRLRKPDDGIAVRMTMRHVDRANVLTVDVHRRTIVERDHRQRVLWCRRCRW